ncbi:hypothetical protein K5549_000528 [Capra hircus]|nr:hypothetical protein K5549_000528 [Capra hircus]
MLCAGFFVTVYMTACQVFKEEKYLKDAVECSDVIWQRGLLRKGYGICHGTAGNGYAFLSLYHITQDKKYLYRACKQAWGSSEIHLVEGTSEVSTPSDGAAAHCGVLRLLLLCHALDHEPGQRLAPSGD